MTMFVTTAAATPEPPIWCVCLDMGRVRSHLWEILSRRFLACCLGSKGVASSYSVAIFTFPLGALGAILIGGAILLINKKMSIMSLAAMLLFFVATLLFQPHNLPLIILAGLLTIVVFVRHADNIRRLIHGEEQRLRKEGKE